MLGANSRPGPGYFAHFPHTDPRKTTNHLTFPFFHPVPSPHSTLVHSFIKPTAPRTVPLPTIPYSRTPLLHPLLAFPFLNRAR